MDEETILTDSAPYGQDEYSENDLQEYEEAEYAGDTEPEEFAELDAEPGEPNAAAESGAEAGNYQPFVPSGNPHLDTLREQLGDELAYSLLNAVRHEQQQGFTAQTYQQSYREQARAAAPQWVEKHRATIDRASAMLPPEIRGTAGAEVMALMAPAVEYAQRTGDVAGAWRMVQQSSGGHTPQAPAQRKPVSLPPQMRTPSPSGGGNAGVRQAQAQQRQPRQSSAMKYLTESLGANPDDAQRFLQEH